MMPSPLIRIRMAASLPVQRSRLFRWLQRLTSLLVLAPVLSSCGKSTAVVDPPRAHDPAHVLSITLSKTTYEWEEVSRGSGIVATVANPDTLDYFANIGDGLYSSLDQPWVYIALGTDSVVERLQDDGTWIEMGTAGLVEGTRVVAIRAGANYEIRGYLTEPRQTGTMRIRLRYFTSPGDSGAMPMTDYSGPFIVR